MKTAVTLSQVAEAKAGPFVFHDPLPDSFAQAKKHGFDAVELFLPGPHFISVDQVHSLSLEHDLPIAAVGTGAGMVKHGLSLTDPDPSKRKAALDFIMQMVDFGGQLKAPAILGSMQGRWTPELPREEALILLAEALHIIASQAARHGVPFIYEPLNRYETNLLNTLAESADFLTSHQLNNVVILADLFHMNIEENNLPQAIREYGSHIGHVHFADSNRRAMGFGHTDSAAIILALRDIQYSGYLSAEVFPLPDPDSCAAQQIKASQLAPTSF